MLLLVVASLFLKLLVFLLYFFSSVSATTSFRKRSPLHGGGQCWMLLFVSYSFGFKKYKKIG